MEFAGFFNGLLIRSMSSSFSVRWIVVENPSKGLIRVLEGGDEHEPMD